MMLYSIRDIKDWQALKQGQIATNKHSFNLDEALEEIKSMANFHLRSHNKSITFIFDPNFSDSSNQNEIFVELM